MNGSVCLSVRLSVTPFWQCSCHRIIMIFSGVITIVTSDVRAKSQGQESKVKVTEVKTQSNRFRTVTPVWIHIWRWHTKLGVAWKRHPIVFQGHLSNFKVTSSQKKSTILTQIERFRTVTPVSNNRRPGIDAQTLKWHIRDALLFLEVILQISRPHGTKKIDDFVQN